MAKTPFPVERLELARALVAQAVALPEPAEPRARASWMRRRGGMLDKAQGLLRRGHTCRADLRFTAEHWPAIKQLLGEIGAAWPQTLEHLRREAAGGLYQSASSVCPTCGDVADRIPELVHHGRRCPVCYTWVPDSFPPDRDE